MNVWSIAVEILFHKATSAYGEEPHTSGFTLWLGICFQHKKNLLDGETSQN